jgi:hypothetical protein
MTSGTVTTSVLQARVGHDDTPPAPDLIDVRRTLTVT